MQLGIFYSVNVYVASSFGGRRNTLIKCDYAFMQCYARPMRPGPAGEQIRKDVSAALDGL